MASKMKELMDGGVKLFTKRPERGASTTSVRAELVGTTEVSVSAGDHTVTFDEPEYIGGTNKAANPTSVLLGSLAACEAIIFRMHSEWLEIPFDHLEVEVEGDLDLRGGLGLDDVRAGYSDVRMTIHLSGSESPERYETLYRSVAANCPVLDTLANPVNLVTALKIEPAGDA